MVNKSGDLSGYFGAGDKKAPEIKIITHKEMADAGVPSQKINRRVVEKLEQNNESVSVKKSPIGVKKSPISGKFVIAAVILLLVVVDIPIGMKIYQGYNSRNNIASLDVSQDTSAAAKNPVLSPSVTPTPASAPAPTITVALSPTPVADDLAQLGTQTHSECFEGACIEVEGSGTDMCFIDSDCEQATSSLATPTPKAAKEVVSPDVPVAGNIKDAVIAISAGLGTILLALLMLL